ncbi:MAG TPA: translesion error-prone DNA polymerase V autoproteolytic subunit [Candidatus Marinimicrobia bacterium]|nr:MAG: peptidase S24 [Candidatus Neomarinimicrobiota bacterium]HIA29020.1 translesion error-prone DNA polymerase V autoproteolytic subunit [Candidatus Neomarinimicrobiota bacterium]HIB58203.1 translesion error-prone DNA polymerase V autoproteolytic subunit [Candidatus Neomarinimicrobiota bacterium]HIC51812.1 translesion error-prone DNA polymerase V autoproteolytic subunit [Candidatus Neomarinimicrobiota bacterium]HIM83918.1 translesion error-prone DNA polymerase V autoproteolytic subunit [Cand
MQLYRINNTGTLDFYSSATTADIKVPLYASAVSAGFPSPADDYLELSLDLNKYLIKHPAATFYVRVKGDSMINAGIHDGDLLIVDKSVEPENDDVVVCVINGEFTVKRLKKVNGEIYLIPENSHYQAVKISENMDFQVWGVVTYTIHQPK